MSPVTEVVAAQSTRAPPAARRRGFDCASSEVLEMSSPDALSEF